MHNMLPSVRPSVPERCPSTARAACPSSPSGPNGPSTARALPERCLTWLGGRDVLLLTTLINKHCFPILYKIFGRNCKTFNDFIWFAKKSLKTIDFSLNSFEIIQIHSKIIETLWFWQIRCHSDGVLPCAPVRGALNYLSGNYNVPKVQSANAPPQKTPQPPCSAKASTT